MTQLERQITTAQHRLWLNRWLHDGSVFVAVAAAIYAAVVLIQRLFDAAIPLFWIGAGLAAAAVVGSVIRTIARRENEDYAAAKLDEAAGLRERLSSGRYCLRAQDPFARAVVADAERTSGSISARQHIRLTMPRPVTWSAASIIAAALMFLISPGLLARTEAREAKEEAVQLEQTKVAVKRKMDAVHKLTEANPALEDLKEHLGSRDTQAGGKLQRPADIRHEAVKKIDRLADAVKQKRKSGKYEATREMRKMLRGLKVPQSADTPTPKLAKALAKGDFKTAKEEINALQEQLATLKSEKDKELVAKISKQLNDMAKQLEQLSSDDKLAQKLKEAGIKKEDMDRLLENLKKEDLDQLKKELEKEGLNPQQIDKLAKQLQRRQQAGVMGKRLAQALGQCAKCNNPGQMGNAMAGMSMAADQLSELEQLEQEMNQLDAAMAELDSTRNDLRPSCPYCRGRGCSRCRGDRPGAGMGGLGQGRGGLAPEEQTAVGFKTERGKVHTGKGAIVGQFFFEGEQVKGDVTSSLSEIVTAAEHDASDRINRNRIPRQYHKAVKNYFSTMKQSMKTAKLKDPAVSTDTDGADESNDKSQDDAGKD